MSTIGSRIRKRREKLGLSQDELAKRLGYRSRSSINKIELDQRNLTQSKIKAIAEALDTTPSYVMGWETKPESDVENIYSVHGTFDESLSKYGAMPIRTKKIPLLGKIACGEPIYCNEERGNYVLTDENIDADFCLIAQGDSMTGARIYNGDVVFIRKQPVVYNGEIAAVCIGDEATLKRVYYYPEKQKLVLSPENSSFEPLIYVGEELEEVHILGKAVAFQSAL